MKFRSKLLAVAAIAASTYSMTSCSAPSGFSYKNVNIAISSYCSDCASGAFLNGGTIYNPAYPAPPAAGSVVLMVNTSQGGTSTFVATVTNAPQTNVTWTLYPQPNLSGITTLPTGTSYPVGESPNPLGTIQAASGNTIYYTVSSPPIYTGAALQQATQLGIPQGDVLLVASVPTDPADPSIVTTQRQLIQVYGATQPCAYLIPYSGYTAAGCGEKAVVPSGQTQPVVTVPRNTSYAFTGGTVGSLPCTSASVCNPAPCTTTCLPLYTTDNSTIWEVGPTPNSLATAVKNGNSLYGTITQQGVYTAPAAIPTATNTFTTISGEVVVYAVANSAQTIAAYAYVLVN